MARRSISRPSADCGFACCSPRAPSPRPRRPQRSRAHECAVRARSRFQWTPGNDGTNIVASGVPQTRVRAVPASDGAAVTRTRSTTRPTTSSGNESDRRHLLLLHPGRRPHHDGQQPGADRPGRHARIRPRRSPSRAPAGGRRQRHGHVTGDERGRRFGRRRRACSTSARPTPVPPGAVIGSTWDTTTVAKRRLRGLQRRHRQRRPHGDRLGHRDGREPWRPRRPRHRRAERRHRRASRRRSRIPRDPAAPSAPTKVSVILPRAKAATGKVAREAALGQAHRAPTSPRRRGAQSQAPAEEPGRRHEDLSGLGTSAVLRLKAGATGVRGAVRLRRHGNVSKPARELVSLASLIPLRPLTGSVVTRLRT